VSPSDDRSARPTAADHLDTRTVVAQMRGATDALRARLSSVRTADRRAGAGQTDRR
jgi:hypothetical protein